MKFWKTFAAVLFLMEAFLFFGGYLLFDFSRSYYGAGAACAFVAAVVIYAFEAQNTKIEALEKRIKELEERK